MNLTLPGNPRYQPSSLQPIFGYDNLMRTVGEVELATLDVLSEIGVITAEDHAKLTPEKRERILAILTSEVDKVERAVTKHDIRAWVRIAQEIVGPPLARYLHIPLTSYDPIETGRSLQYLRAHTDAVRPRISEVARIFSNHIRRSAETIQIGRTHGQHALPITVGFWLATLLSRILTNAGMMDFHARGLVGKISGAVGAKNAQFGLLIEKRCLETPPGTSFERRVLDHLGLKPGEISTQILQPEPLAYYLHAAVLLSASFGQLGRDCRQLMRSEIAEVQEEFEEGQVGSSTMAHKRNPINWEKLEGFYIKTTAEYLKVLMTLISEHQRDLVGSSVSRDFPIIIVNVVEQLETLLRKNKKGVAFLSCMSINEKACSRNFEMNSDFVLAEPIYIALQMAGYEGDAHHLINHVALPLAKKLNSHLAAAVASIALEDEALMSAFMSIPEEIRTLLYSPERYTGDASKQALAIADWADERVRILEKSMWVLT